MNGQSQRWKENKLDIFNFWTPPSPFQLNENEYRNLSFLIISEYNCARNRVFLFPLPLKLSFTIITDIFLRVAYSIQNHKPLINTLLCASISTSLRNIKSLNNQSPNSFKPSTTCRNNYYPSTQYKKSLKIPKG